MSKKYDLSAIQDVLSKILDRIMNLFLVQKNL